MAKKNAHAVALGRRGGAGGNGKAKRRPRAHYQRIAKLSAKVRRKK